MTRDDRTYDVVLVTDCRLPGGTAASVAEEITAQHRAGYRTGLVHVDSHLVGHPRPFNPRVARLVEDGAADVLVGDAPVRARAVTVRLPPVLTAPDLRLPPITADVCVVVANQTPRDLDDARVHYDVDEVDAIAAERFGSRPLWAPIGPLVRRRLEELAPHVPLTERDWSNVIDVDAWAAPRTAFVSDRPVIGRHGRDDPRKWPASRQDILAAYPDDDGVEVRVLGGVEQALVRLRSMPPNWTSHPFGTMPPERFLAGIDFFVYFHHPNTVEAFGRTILEAMASGTVAVLPPHFRELFGDGPIYTSPSGVRRAVTELHADHDAYLERSRRGQAFVREHYGHEAHVARLEALIGPPQGEPGAPAPSPSTSTAALASDERPRVLFVSSNGAGVGHLMRLMAMARRAGDEVVPLFLTLSQAVPVVRENGFFVEYLASRGFSRMDFRDWHTLLRDRLDELIRTHGVRAIVFDGTWPFQGLFGAAEDHPEVALVWSRRAMWRADVHSPLLASAGDFDLVLEPGEFAEAVDAGPTVARRDEAVRVGPVSFLDPGESLERDQARRELGLDPQRPAVLVQLGAGNINDIDSLVGAVTDRLVAEEGLQVCVTRSVIAEQATGVEAEVIPITGVYPLARYLHAFDFAVAAAGYNTFHESLAAGLPTIFVPNLDTAYDDQAARATYAAAAGVGLALVDPTPDAIDTAITTMLDPERRERMAAEARRRSPANGAADAMRAIEQLLGIGPGPATERATGDLERVPAGPAAARTVPSGSGAPARARAPGLGRRLRRSLALLARSPRLRQLGRRVFRSLPGPARASVRTRLRRWEVTGWRMHDRTDERLRVPAGSLLPAAETQGLTGTLVVLPSDADAATTARLVERVAGLQVAHRGVAPVFATFCDDLTPFRHLGLVPEVLPSREVWSRVRPADEWEEFVRARLQHLVEVWDVRQVVALGEVEGLSAQQLAALSVRAAAAR